MPTYRLVVEYEGSAFAGWQIQAEGESTVQGELIAAVARVTGEQARLTGAGRTDAGVHAEGQVASLELESEWLPDRLLRALNGVLPRAVAIREISIAHKDFDARRDATGKRYRYRIWNAPMRSPLRAARFAHIPKPLDIGAMRQAAAWLLGEHDFASFQAAGSDVRTSVRCLERLDVTGEAAGEIEIVAEGRGFLRYMVRNLVGTLIEVGHGRRAADSMTSLLESRSRTSAGPTAPAVGLTLERVEYAVDSPASD
jgi:tRNA pseudouridine38-40 synthase